MWNLLLPVSEKICIGSISFPSQNWKRNNNTSQNWVLKKIEFFWVFLSVSFICMIWSVSVCFYRGVFRWSSGCGARAEAAGHCGLHHQVLQAEARLNARVSGQEEQQSPQSCQCEFIFSGGWSGRSSMWVPVVSAGAVSFGCLRQPRNGCHSPDAEALWLLRVLLLGSHFPSYSTWVRNYSWTVDVWEKLKTIFWTYQ